MLGRALGSAALAIAVCFSVSAPAQAQNLEAGKSPAQIFNGACTVCHKSPRGLVKSVPPNALPGFLRQHYTTSSDMAGALSGYLLANGAVDRRPGAERSRRGREAPAAAAPAAAPQPAPAQNSWWPFQRQPAAQTAVPDHAGEAAQHPSRKQRSKHKKKRKTPAQEAAPQQPPRSAADSDNAKPEGASSPAPKSEPAHSAQEARPDPVPAVTPAAEPKAAEPKAAEPKAAEPKATEPKGSEPKSSDSKAE